LAEFTLNAANGDDFYDVSLVDGYNLAIRITPSGGKGACGVPGCTSNLNTHCPAALQVHGHVLLSSSLVMLLFLSLSLSPSLCLCAFLFLKE
jgi:hypothetical protein